MKNNLEFKNLDPHLDEQVSLKHANIIVGFIATILVLVALYTFLVG